MFFERKSTSRCLKSLLKGGFWKNKTRLFFFKNKMCCIYCIYNGVGDINVGFTTRSMDFTLVARELWEEGKSPLYETAFVYYKSLLKWVTALMIMVSTICQENHVTSKQRMLMKQSCGNKKGACFMHLKQICWFWDMPNELFWSKTQGHGSTWSCQWSTFSLPCVNPCCVLGRWLGWKAQN